MTDANEKPAKAAGKKKLLKKFGLGAIIFFTIKGIISTSIIIAAALGVRGCVGG